MRQKTKHTLITAEIMGFFLIMIAVLAILTGRRVFVAGAFVLFVLILAVAAMFAVFATLAVKEERGTLKRKKK